MSATQQRLSICLLLVVGLASLRPRPARGDVPVLSDWFMPPVSSAAARSPRRAASPSAPSGTAARIDSAREIGGARMIGEARDIPYSDFVGHVERHEVASVDFSGQRIHGTLRDGRTFATRSPGTRNGALVDRLIRDQATVAAAPPTYAPPGAEIVDLLLGGLDAALPMLLLIGAWLYLNGRLRGSAGSIDPTRMRRSPAQPLAPGTVKTTLRDVAGIDEVKQEVGEIVDFLRDPLRYAAVGARIPSGVLLVGPPGTGKTLLARAIAGEAGVPFFPISGSAFVEMYAGIGAARVRDLFAQARAGAPCIVFIDEIDAVGRNRSAGGAGGNDEREQTLNQLLVEMDGFAGAQGIIVIAATNRPDVLDPALLRPGRFDRRIVVPLPDVRGREAIARVHLRAVRAARDVSPAAIARAAAGFSGAELANLINEAALAAARDGAGEVAWKHFECALDKLTLGLERSVRPTEEERRTTAYHEAGHALVSLHVPEHDPVRKISIIPHGSSLGATSHLPGERASCTRRALESRLCTLLGGRVAEELALGADGVTTGAENDLERASELAYRMVAQYGLSEELGPVCYARGGDMTPDAQHSSATPFGAAGGAMCLSRETAGAVDRIARALIERSRARARAILEAHRSALHALAAALLRLETLDAAQISAIVGSSVLAAHAPRRHPRRRPDPLAPCLRGRRRAAEDTYGSGPAQVRYCEREASLHAPAPG